MSLQSDPVSGATKAMSATAGAGAVPYALVNAYDRAVLAAPTECHLTVSLLSAIGEVESGNLAGRTVDARNRVTPAVFGPLPRRGAAHGLRDTDDGLWDESSRWDRGVGPMMLIPSAWRTVAVDLDGDSLRDPQDVYDAAGAAMAHLCKDGRDLSTPAGLREAVLGYHDSPEFLRSVLTWERHFATEPLVQSTSTFDFLPVGVFTATPTVPQDLVPPPAPTTARAMTTRASATADPATPAGPQPTAAASAATTAPSPPAQASEPAAPATHASPPAAPSTPAATPTDPEPTPTCPTLTPGATPSPGAVDPEAAATSVAPAPDATTLGGTEPTVPPGCPPLPTASPTAPTSTPAP